MREIKFRAWDKEKQGWVCGSPLSLCVWLKSDANKWLGNDIFLKNIDFQQFTGLFDKNGTEIYEGDIFEHMWKSGTTGLPLPETRTLWVIEFNDVEYSFLGKKILGSDKIYPIKYKALGEFEYLSSIGNIYEHPELLNSK